MRGKTFQQIRSSPITCIANDAGEILLARDTVGWSKEWWSAKEPSESQDALHANEKVRS